jgi:hypothetical protein
MKKLSVLFISLFALLQIASAGAQKKADNDTQEWRYEIEAVGTGAQGSYQIKVWSYSKKEMVATEQSKKNAVHGIIFKGFASNTSKRITGKPALARNPALEQEHADFFKQFFADGGKYMKYVQLVNGTTEKIKYGKEYKIGVIVNVNVSDLRKDLEAAGIIKGLGGGF